MDSVAQVMTRTERKIHIPVFLPDITGFLAREDAQIIDGTLGDGGHAKELLEKSGASAKLLGLDLDQEGLQRASSALDKFGDRVTFIHDTFANIAEIALKESFNEPTGILFDLGMSTWHLQAERGFSFKNSGLLDMRFDGSGSVELPSPELVSLKRLARKNPFYNAADILNELHEEELAELISTYGEDRFAERIAGQIVSQRRDKPFESVEQLVQSVVTAYPRGARHGRIHVATKTFQALRIAVNREYETLRLGIKQSLDLLRGKGRLAIISFHSGEDRIAKQMFKDASLRLPFKLLTRHAIKPGFSEIGTNPWSRSARLRVIEKK